MFGGGAIGCDKTLDMNDKIVDKEQQILMKLKQISTPFHFPPFFYG
jgi:hypothetical protein